MVVNISKNDPRINNLLERIAAETPAKQTEALVYAQEHGDKETAAAVARIIRNRLLSDCDKDMIIDRNTAALDFSSALKFVASLKNILTGEIAEYRQQLRDITTAPGFPLNFEFPTPPGDDADTEALTGVEL